MLERLDALPAASFEGSAYRFLRTVYEPLSGAGAQAQGGRWNPPGSFPTLYLGLSPAVVLAEFDRHLRRQGLRRGDVLDYRVYEYRVALQAVVDLRTPDARAHIGLQDLDLGGGDLRRCQAVGAAAHYLGLEALLAPSTTGAGDAFSVFLDRQRPGSPLEVVGSAEPPSS